MKYTADRSAFYRDFAFEQDPTFNPLMSQFLLSHHNIFIHNVLYFLPVYPGHFML